MGQTTVEIAIEASLNSDDSALDRAYSLYILEAGDVPEATLALAQAIRRRHGDTPLLIISSDYRRALLLELFAGSSLNHCIAKQGAVSAGLPLIDETELIVTCNKLLTHDIFGIAKYIRFWGIEVAEARVRRSSEKDAVIGRIERFLGALDSHGVIARAVLTTADELIMNAIFNAPRRTDGTPKYAHLNRNDDFDLDPREEVTITYACDGRYIGISVSDNFGSLSREVIFRYLRDSIEGRAATMETKEGGAGLGIHMLSKTVTQLVFNVHPGVRTEVIALFYVRNGPRAFKEAGRSLNIFFSDGVTSDFDVLYRPSDSNDQGEEQTWEQKQA